jgi:hypothetical protein
VLQNVKKSRYLVNCKEAEELCLPACQYVSGGKCICIHENYHATVKSARLDIQIRVKFDGKIAIVIGSY